MSDTKLILTLSHGSQTQIELVPIMAPLRYMTTLALRKPTSQMSKQKILENIIQTTDCYQERNIADI